MSVTTPDDDGDVEDDPLEVEAYGPERNQRQREAFVELTERNILHILFLKGLYLLGDPVDQDDIVNRPVAVKSLPPPAAADAHTGAKREEPWGSLKESVEDGTTAVGTVAYPTYPGQVVAYSPMSVRHLRRSGRDDGFEQFKQTLTRVMRDHMGSIHTMNEKWEMAAFHMKRYDVGADWESALPVCERLWREMMGRGPTGVPDDRLTTHPPGLALDGTPHEGKEIVWDDVVNRGALTVPPTPPNLPKERRVAFACAVLDHVLATVIRWQPGCRELLLAVRAQVFDAIFVKPVDRDAQTFDPAVDTHVPCSTLVRAYTEETWWALALGITPDTDATIHDNRTQPTPRAPHPPVAPIPPSPVKRSPLRTMPPIPPITKKTLPPGGELTSSLHFYHDTLTDSHCCTAEHTRLLRDVGLLQDQLYMNAERLRTLEEEHRLQVAPVASEVHTLSKRTAEGQKVVTEWRNSVAHHFHSVDEALHQLQKVQKTLAEQQQSMHVEAERAIHVRALKAENNRLALVERDLQASLKAERLRMQKEMESERAKHNTCDRERQKALDEERKARMQLQDEVNRRAQADHAKHTAEQALLWEQKQRKLLESSTASERVAAQQRFDAELQQEKERCEIASRQARRAQDLEVELKNLKAQLTEEREGSEREKEGLQRTLQQEQTRAEEEQGRAAHLEQQVRDYDAKAAKERQKNWHLEEERQRLLEADAERQRQLRGLQEEAKRIGQMQWEVERHHELARQWEDRCVASEAEVARLREAVSGLEHYKTRAQANESQLQQMRDDAETQRDQSAAMQRELMNSKALQVQVGHMFEALMQQLPGPHRHGQLARTLLTPPPREVSWLLSWANHMLERHPVGSGKKLRDFQGGADTLDAYLCLLNVVGPHVIDEEQCVTALASNDLAKAQHAAQAARQCLHGEDLISDDEMLSEATEAQHVLLLNALFQKFIHPTETLPTIMPAGMAIADDGNGPAMPPTAEQFRNALHDYVGWKAAGETLQSASDAFAVDKLRGLQGDQVAKQPRSPPEYVARGDELREAGDYQRAMQYYNRAIELDPQLALAYVRRGSLRQHNFNEHDDALKDFNRALKLNPTYGDAYRARADLMHYQFSDYRNALDDYNKAIQYGRTDADTYCNRAECLRALHNNAAALEDFEQALRAVPGHVRARRGRDELFPVVSHEQKAKARKALEEALARLPTIQFERNKAGLDKGDVVQLEQVGNIMQQFRLIHIKVIGITVNRSKLKLASARADACIEYLVVKKGIDRNRMESDGRYGTQMATMFEPA